jgi:DNA polymerase-3 subunit alpha
MAGVVGEKQYIMCSKCKSKYHDNEEDVKEHFGYKRLGDRYKTCIKCRKKNNTTKPIKENEQYIIVVDVETNGLIKDRYVQPIKSNLYLFPNIVQFSWGLYTPDGDCKEIKDYIIKPDGWSLNGSERVHGITPERASTEGISIKEVLEFYKNDINNRCLKIVCHNANFDLRVIKSELLRAEIELNDIETYCTMKEGITYCRITPKIRGEYKWPTLEQLYYKCFNNSLNKAHNSYYDVIHCAQCYFKLIKET